MEKEERAKIVALKTKSSNVALDEDDIQFIFDLIYTLDDKLYSRNDAIVQMDKKVKQLSATVNKQDEVIKQFKDRTIALMGELDELKYGSKED